MTGMHWTPTLVEERLVEAADTLRRLPERRVQGFLSAWPEVVREAWGAHGWADGPTRQGPPSPQAIDRMDVTLGWLRWLDPADAKLVWVRAEGTPWKGIGWRFGVSVKTAQRRWDYALSLITWRLLGRTLPSTWSRRFLMDRVQFLSSGN